MTLKKIIFGAWGGSVAHPSLVPECRRRFIVQFSKILILLFPSIHSVSGGFQILLILLFPSKIIISLVFCYFPRFFLLLSSICDAFSVINFPSNFVISLEYFVISLEIYYFPRNSSFYSHSSPFEGNNENLPKTLFPSHRVD